jgi:hypothetical protein
MQEDEILSVARFKLGETARRLVVLAESAADAGVRATLIGLSEVLFSEQRDLEQRARGGSTIERETDPLATNGDLSGYLPSGR